MWHGAGLLLLAACNFLSRSVRVDDTPAEATWSLLERQKEEATRHLTGPLVDFPAELESEYSVVRYLGTGLYGESWLVTDRDKASSMYEEQVVVKLLYLDEGMHPEHLTWRKAQGDHWLLQGAREAARECEIMAELRKRGVEGKAPGAVRIQTCYGHNVPSGTEDTSARPDMPLFLVFEKSDGDHLAEFMRKKAEQDELSVELVSELFQHILEGVDYLASLADPWVHHDLKPDSIIVETHADGNHSAHLIDFGAASRATEAFACNLTASTAFYAPKEWGIYASDSCPRQNFLWSESCPTCATAFDMFAAAAILLELVTGSRLHHLREVWGVAKLRYDAVDGFAGRPELFAEHMRPGSIHSGTQGAYSKLMESFLSPESDSAAFFNAVMGGLHKDPAARPTAAALLQHSFMAGFGQHFSSAVVAPVDGPCRFKAGEVVELFNSSAQDYGEARVAGLENDSISLEWMGASERSESMTCHSPKLRKLSETRPSIALQGGYRPAVGSELPGYDGITRRSTDSSCPALCDECERRPNLSVRQYICWSPTGLDDLNAQKTLTILYCRTESTFEKTSFHRVFLGYLCSP